MQNVGVPWGSLLYQMLTPYIVTLSKMPLNPLIPNISTQIELQIYTKKPKYDILRIKYWNKSSWFNVAQAVIRYSIKAQMTKQKKSH